MRREVWVAFALLLSACAPPGYVYEAGDFFHPHPSAELCESRGLVLDSITKECVMPPPPPLPPRHVQEPPPARPHPPSPPKQAAIDVPIEPNAKISSDLRTNKALLRELMRFVTESHYLCRSISAVRADAASREFELACDHAHHDYEIEALANRWIVTPR
jgi:hypothetical protein